MPVYDKDPAPGLPKKAAAFSLELSPPATSRLRHSCDRGHVGRGRALGPDPLRAGPASEGSHGEARPGVDADRRHRRGALTSPGISPSAAALGGGDRGGRTVKFRYVTVPGTVPL